MRSFVASFFICIGGFAAATATASTVANQCGINHRGHLQSYEGQARQDETNAKIIDQMWLSRIVVGHDNLAQYAGGPIWDGDSTANDDANYQSEMLSTVKKPEYQALGWKHPINLAVGGDNVTNLLYRLYALEQRSTFRVARAPWTLKRNVENALFRVTAPFMVLHVGSNAVDKSESAADIVSDIEALTCEISNDLPRIDKVVVMSIYPRGAFFAEDSAKRIAVNQALSQAATANQYPFIFVDATHYLESLCRGHFDSKGQCPYFKDLVHPMAPAAFVIDQMIARAVTASGGKLQ